MSDTAVAVRERTIVETIEGSVHALYRYYGRSPLTELKDGPDMIRLASHIPSPVFNTVAGAWLAAGRADRTIEETLAYFRAERATALLWWVGPSTLPHDLGRRLQQHGFRLTSHMPGMAIDLTLPREGLPAPAGLRVAQVEDAGQLRQWCEMLGEGFDMPADVVEVLNLLEATLGYEPSLPWRRYLGLLDGQPVAASALLLDAETASIYNVAVHPAFRRRGLGAALTLAPLREAQALGYCIGVLQSTPMGEALYRRLGFVEYCRLDQYIRPLP